MICVGLNEVIKTVTSHLTVLKVGLKANTSWESARGKDKENTSFEENDI